MDNVQVLLPGRTETPSVVKSGDRLILNYPCTKTYNCSSYEVILDKGTYNLELYGASGGYTTNTPSTIKNNDNYRTCAIKNEDVSLFGGNTVCNNSNTPGAGAYISGIITLRTRTKLFARVGGKGQYCTSEETKKGGFNGGGDTLLYSSPSSSGGGASDIRVGEDDVWHRIIVAGGGGGCDDIIGNDGFGGAGGYPEGQGYWISAVYNKTNIATQLYGFSFGQGESGGETATKHPNSSYQITTMDIPGAGGGWFGGHSGHHYNGGAGGGSSFVLTKKAIIPQGNIPTHTSQYKELESKPYAFSGQSIYAMKGISYANGIWAGNGFIRITLLNTDISNYSCARRRNNPSFILQMILVIVS